MKRYYFKILTVISGIIISPHFSLAQDAVGIGSSNILNPNSLLDINSSNKGIILPVMSTEERMDIKEPANGLIVFDGKENKFYYYSLLDKKWTSVEPIPSKVIMPWFGDVSYFDQTGKGLGYMKGWALCNGKNNTPDLSGHFIAGYSKNDKDYNSIGRSNIGRDFVTLKGNEMPSHIHDSDDSGHFHESYLQNKGNHSHQSNIRNNQAFINAGYSDDGTYLTYSGGLTTKNITTDLSSLEASLEDNSADISLKNTGGNVQHENRPSYKVMIYIMKL